jgi:hypothetical protein
MSSSRILSLCALLAFSLSAGCSGCDPKKSDPTPTASCTDGSKNGTETDVDCGGATCVAEGKTCADTRTCAVAADCTNGYCNASNVCATPTCTDGVKNGTETDVDCGGATCDGQGKTCADTRTCAVAADCTNGYCNASNVCATPTCTDGVKNGTETDVDCGGATCDAQGKTCVNTKACLVAADCTSTYCDPTYRCADACGGTGATCTDGGQCCLGNCDTTCQPPTLCTGTGGACTTGNTCCSGLCNGTSCVEPCTATGWACGTAAECCTGLCSGTPTKSCQPPPICTNDGGGCSADATCCSGLCNGTTCVKPCARNDLGCDFGSDCCSGYCNALKKCETRPALKDNGATCTVDSECLSDYCNPLSHVCETAVSTCRDPGLNCTINGECCSGACSGGKCTTTAFCAVPGALCASPSDCCSLSCVGGLCSDNACNATGTTCSVGTDCCTGLCSGTPTSCQPLPGASTCKTLADSCTLSSECCSTNCQGGVCTPAYLCHSANDICYANDECCSGMCSATSGAAGRCILPSGGCNQDGNPCANASNCCTRLCVDMGAGVTVCKPSSGCRMTGDYCDQTEACCGGSPDLQRPDGYKIFCDTLGKDPNPPRYDTSATDDFRCGGGTACNPPGNICGAAGDPASQNCCNGKKAVCKRDSQGIARCFGGCPNDDCTTCPNGYGWQYDPPCCIGTDPGVGGSANVCQFRDQCCGGVPCVPDATGVLRCTAPTCTALHGACAGADDGSCCVGTSCEFNGTTGSFTCEVPVSCTVNGLACNVASDCCSNNCTGGVCAPPCANTGGTCTLDECCSGLYCFKDPPNASSGVCNPVASCASHGSACDAALPCCPETGDVCLGGVCAAPPTCKAQYATCVPTDSCCTTPAGMTCMEADGATCATGSTTCSCDNCSAGGGTCNPSASPSGCCLGLTCNGTGTTGTCGSCALLGTGCTADGGTDTCCSSLYCSNPATFEGGAACTAASGCTCDSCLPLATPCSPTGTTCCGESNSCYDESMSICDVGSVNCTCQPNPG